MLPKTFANTAKEFPIYCTPVFIYQKPSQWHIFHSVTQISIPLYSHKPLMAGYAFNYF